MSHAQNSRGRRNWAGAHVGSGPNSSNNKKSALSAAYAELGKELTSGKLRSIGTYTLGKPIGEGTYGKVRLGTHRLTGVRVAIKQVPKAHSATLTREIHHHRRLHHPNIMQLYEVLASESYIWMVTELCAGGELYDYLVERGTMPEPEARRIFGQLCMAVAYIHNRGIVHRDLKLENVLLDEKCNVKLGDFGFTREFEAKKLMETFCGTTGYAAPEMLAGRRYTGEEVDVWSLGVILYALICGTLPFDDDDDAIMKAKILKGEFELPDLISEECADLITKILQQDPTARPTIKEILGHPWFTKVMAPFPMETVNEDVHDAEPSDATSDPSLSNSRFLTASSNLLATSPGEIEEKGEQKNQKGTNDEDLAHKISSSGLSETSFFSAQSKSDSESSDRQSSHTQTTSPTTDGGDEESRNARQIAEELKPTLIPLSLKHRNESQTTIKRQTSASSDASRIAAVASSSKTSAPLPTHIEGEVNGPDRDEILAPIMALSAPIEKHSSQSSSSRGASGHHRTPSRTKRRSSGGLSDHHPPSLDMKPIDYISLLEHSTPAIFSTVLEQNLLHQLSGLGMDVGQIVHSVVNEACDASGATWWILKKKAEEKLQQEHDQGLSPYMTTYTLAQAPVPALLSNIEQTRTRYDSSTSEPLHRDKAKSGRASPALSQRDVIRPLAVKATEAQVPHVVQKANNDKEKLPNRPRLDSDTTFASGSGSALNASHLPDVQPDPAPAAAAVLPATNTKQRSTQSRNRASSFSVRLTQVLAGKDKDSRVGEGETSIMIGNEQFVIEERSKSPVMPGFFSKKSERNSPSPASTPKADKKKDTKSPLRPDAKDFANGPNKNETKRDDKRHERREQDSSSGSPKRKEKVSKENGQNENDLKATKSFETFSTITSTSHDEGSQISQNRKGKGPKSSFLHTVRNWLGTDDKNSGSSNNAGSTSAKKKKRRQSQTAKQQSSVSQRPVQSTSVKRAPSVQGFGPTSPAVVGRSGSLRRQHPVAYSSVSAGRSPRLSQRGSISRRSSSGSVQYATLGQRPLNTRRPSAGSITPTTAGLGMEDYPIPIRHSRPSSAQSHNRPFGTLHTKSGSTGSSNSFVRLQSHGSGYSGSLRGIHARRPSADGGTTVRRHRHYPHHARSDSLSRSRPSTPNRNSMILEDASMDTITPRRSLDLDYGSRSSSVMNTPRANQSVFVAHRSRTPYKPPSANPSLGQHHTNNDHSLGHSNILPGRLYYHGIQPPTAFGTWRRSWGKPPPSWAGPVDQQSSVDETLISSNAGGDQQSEEKVTNKPKLRDIFTNRESDDDWEDEDDEPMYAGGLGQLASSSWASDPSMPKGKAVQPGTSVSKRNEGMPTSILNSGKYTPIRNLFQPPSLGTETMPRAWIMSSSEDGKGELSPSGGVEGGEKEMKSSSSPLRKSIPLLSNSNNIGANSLDLHINTIPEQPKDNLSASTASPITSAPGSRVRSTAPTFKGPVTIEEEEEDE